jgi:hypothetical protein
MSKIVTIPTDGGNPFVVILGGVKYVYKPGETVEVPDGVALEIEEWERWHEKYYVPTQPPFDDDDAGGGAVASSVEPMEDDIPKVFFGGALQQTKDEAVVPFRYISKTEDISGYAEIKAQGNSTMRFPKKNQTVKMYKDAACEEKLKVDFKGWGKQSKHC